MILRTIIIQSKNIRWSENMKEMDIQLKELLSTETLRNGQLRIFIELSGQKQIKLIQL